MIGRDHAKHAARITRAVCRLRGHGPMQNFASGAKQRRSVSRFDAFRWLQPPLPPMSAFGWNAQGWFWRTVDA